ncbi:MAG: hypothetical protein ACNA7I_01750 [Candidatus Methanoperedens sp.]
MNRKILVILVITIMAFAGVQHSLANIFIKGTFTELYDVSGTKLDSCQTCMASTTPPVSWNAYGTDLRSDIDFSRNNPEQAMRNIESLDSDGDGFTNIEEIRNLTFPGDPSDFPVSETPLSTPEDTPARQQTPVPEETETVSTNSVTAFATLVMFAAVYFLAFRKKE